MRFTLIPVLIALVAGLSPAQQNPEPYRTPPPNIFQGDKKDKDEDRNVRSVQGFVRSPDDQPAGDAVVQLKDTKTLQVRSFITKEDGQYRFHGLSTNIDYQIKADRQGSASPVKTISVFDSRKIVTINLKLESKK